MLNPLYNVEVAFHIALAASLDVPYHSKEMVYALFSPTSVDLRSGCLVPLPDSLVLAEDTPCVQSFVTTRSQHAFHDQSHSETEISETSENKESIETNNCVETNKTGPSESFETLDSDDLNMLAGLNLSRAEFARAQRKDYWYNLLIKYHKLNRHKSALMSVPKR